MKTSLVIDTSTPRTIAAIIEQGVVTWSGFHDGATSHGEALGKLIDEAKNQATFKSINQVVVGMGPGPFTGLRVGIAFAHSFALAREIPVRGVCSLDAIAAQVTDKDFIITVDARRKEVYWARYTHGVRVGEPAVNFPTDVTGAPIHARYPSL